jgi:hypothetical protein
MNIDTINRNWIDKLHDKANLYEDNKLPIIDFSDTELHYLIYWNWGYSGVSTAADTINAKNELIARGIEYNEELAEQINELCEELY